MNRAYYGADVQDFLFQTPDFIVGKLAASHPQDLIYSQTNAWKVQIALLQTQLATLESGQLFFEFAIPRMGRRADAVLLLRGIVFVIEFKIGSSVPHASDRRQLEGYALDLKNFHEGSHDLFIVPILVNTRAQTMSVDFDLQSDGVFSPVCSNGMDLHCIIEQALERIPFAECDPEAWLSSSYRPTPTIIEAAQALYADHDVEEIARNDAGAKNMEQTSQRVREIIGRSRSTNRKSICFVTGVPGSGKTLVGLDLATSSVPDERAVFLSGNGPLVTVLREALVRDEVARTPGLSKANSSRKVNSFVQNVHHFRDEALRDSVAPDERIVVFDEAQRAWDAEHTARFMISKRGQSSFELSEPEFLIQVMDRHQGWCVIVALIGGGQEIHTGEAGLEGWRNAIQSMFPHWDVYFSDHLSDLEYAGGAIDFSTLPNAICSPEPALHLSVSMRSFRAENLSTMVHHLVAGDAQRVSEYFAKLHLNYPIVITRDLQSARTWLVAQARGNESKGIIASSGALRLRPNGIFVKNEIDPAYWFLNPQEDVRSCHALEDVATEFDIQGLELDWTIVAWDADYRFATHAFEHWKFRGTSWQRVRARESMSFLENAYRVLLTRARQGMAIFVPIGSSTDDTRHPRYYDETFKFLRACGFPEI